MPNTEQEWLRVAKEFETKWNIPHCLGIIDGKQIHNLLKAKYMYTNKRGFSNIIFLALIDADYNFMLIDVKYIGNISKTESQTFALCTELKEGRLNLPQPAPLYGENKQYPYFFVVNDALPISENVMQSYSRRQVQATKHKVFNSRLSRAFRVADNVFGKISSVFRIFTKSLLIEPEKASMIVITVAILHNFLRQRPHSADLYTPSGTFDYEESGEIINGSWRNAINKVNSFVSLKHTLYKTSSKGIKVREDLADYFLNVENH